jgi:parallel beta-helix repeat protein
VLRRAIAAVALVGSCIVVTSPAPAAALPTTLYVDIGNAGCSDGGSGTLTQPYCTIRKGAATAVAGQTVIVYPGLYGGGISVSNSGTSAAPIVIRSAADGVTVSGGINGFKVSGKSWVTIRGFVISQTSGAGVYVKSASNVTVDANDVSFSGLPQSGQIAPGVKLSGTTASVVVGNVVHHNTDHGILLTSSPNGNVVRNNVSHTNARMYTRAAEGILIDDSPGTTVQANITHDNEDSGLGIWKGSNNTVAFDNVTHRNGDHGIDILQSTGVTVVSNTVYDNDDSGIELASNAAASLANNIIADNGINSPRTSGNIRVADTGSASLSTFDYELLNLSSGNVLIDWLGAKYSSLSAFQAATGRELNGIQGDPRFVDPSSGDFRLMAGSPAIDSAHSGAAGQPETDAAGVPRIDDLATPNTGAGPRGYDDRGAYEHVPDNLAPVANDDSAITGRSTPVTVDVLANDSDPDDDPLTVTGATAPAHGTAVVNPDNTITYAPDTDYTGPDSFGYEISDGNGGTASATVSIVVNDPPSPTAVSLSLDQGTAAVVTLAGSDPDADPLTFKVVASAAHGELYDGNTSGHLIRDDELPYSLTGTGILVTYKPDAGYTGTDSFAFIANDGHQDSTSTAAVSITVNDVNIAPVAGNDSAITAQSTPVTVDVLANDSDPDDDPLTVTGATAPAHGTAVVNPDNTITYAPDSDYTGPDSFGYEISDGNGGTASATVSIVVNTPNLVLNPGFEVNTSGWQTGSSSTSLSRVSGGHSGGWAARLSNTSAGAQCALEDKPNWVDVTQAGPYTSSIWVRSDTPGLTFKLRVREYQGGVLVGSAAVTVTLTTSWQHVVVGYVPVAPGQSTLDFQAYTVSSPLGVCFYADDASVLH